MPLQDASIMDTRLTNLEVKVAFQDDLLESLNRTVATQQQELEILRQQLRMLYEQLRSLTPSEIASPAEEPPPPHY
jgi:SlyX protein